MMLKDIFEKESIIFGCGNPLLGDDGFGPAVIDYVNANCSLPDHAACMDVGTSIRDILFDILLSEKKPRQIVIVDAVDHQDRSPGEVFEISIDGISPAKIGDFSLHQFPTTNMLKEITTETSVNVRILVVQIEYIPDHIKTGLSDPVRQAIPEMCDLILKTVTEKPF
ncbi:hydrogenase maturation protease [Desulfobacterales bacterium HSG16]|nr:hydrogenase maturation protease [Desulfobacterales bacterium HSG16]